jgi:SAM-dependent methyltransferase
MNKRADRLHLGAGDVRFLGWYNLDLSRGYDLRDGLPGWADATVDAVYSCHLLEHLSYAEGQFLLEEIYRVLRPGGVARLGVPDFRLFVEAYVADDLEFSRNYFRRYVPPRAPAGLPDPAGAELRDFAGFGPIAGLLGIVYGWDHRSVYDERVLRTLLRRAGFTPDDIFRSAFGHDSMADLHLLDRHFADHTLFMEARK